MILEHIGLSQINGSLVVLEGVPGVQYDEMVELHLDNGSTRLGAAPSWSRMTAASSRSLRARTA